MLGSDDHEVLADEPVDENDLFGEDNPTLLPPLSSVDDGVVVGENNNEEATGGEGRTANEEDNESGQPEKKRKKQVNRLPNLNEHWLTNPKMEGLHKVNGYFENIRYYAKGEERTNLHRILKRYEYWAQQCYPKLCFQDFVEKVEGLSGKGKIKNALREIRSGTTQQNEDDGDISNDFTQSENNQMQSNEEHKNVDSNENSNIDKESVNISQTSPEDLSSQATPVVINDELREIIHRKREEAIAKRKKTLEKLENSNTNEETEDLTDSIPKSQLPEKTEDISDVTDGSIVSPSKNEPPLNDKIHETVDFNMSS